MFRNKEDLRIHNTKEFVYEALNLLLKKYNYHHISISMIIKKSGVGRTTFYRHFYSKDDILKTKLKSQTLDLLELLNKTYDLTLYNKDISGKINFFFQYWDRNPEIIQLIIDLDKTQLLYSTWTSLLIDMFSIIDMGLSSNISKPYTAHFAIGGLTSLLIQWFKNNRKDSIYFIAKHFNIPN
ncbi:TetR/AcrR family transcriptional regulator [Mycoplasmatota bacterium]|nr:TetR/AcrR family transcriptional regulator [Mycoplasmatota bacterium]